MNQFKLIQSRLWEILFEKQLKVVDVMLLINTINL